jgi:SH3-like domain-containing protein
MFMRIVPLPATTRKINNRRTPLWLVAAAFASGLVLAGALYMRGGSATSAAVTTAKPGDVTASTRPVEKHNSVTGLPIPRFVTLKAGKVNVRKGPSSDHAVAWVFQRKGMPVEITAEFENWRKIRDSDGEEGWILQGMLSGKRNAMVAQWAKDKQVVLLESNTEKSDAVVRLASGVLGAIETCDGQWCYIVTEDYEGYARQTDLWGVYPGEALD